MKPNRKTVLTYAIFFSVLIIWGFVSSISKAGPKTQVLQIPELSFIQSEYPGTTPNYRNKSVIYVWATWCTVCKASLPLAKWNHVISKWFQIPFISIEEGEDLKALENYITANSIYFPIAIGSPALMSQLGVKGYPTTILIDKDGYKVYHDEGILTPIGLFLRLLTL